MKKIVVDGATSMIGVSTIETAIEKGTEVYAIVRNNTKRIDRLPHSNLLHVVHGSLDDLKSISDIPGDIDVYYHFAWDGTSKDDRNNPFIQEKNIEYTLDAVDLARRCGCKKFIGAGSQAEYGPRETAINDNTPFAPQTSYGIAKFASGQLSRKLCEQYGINHVWARVFSIYGRFDNDGTMLSYAIDRFLKGEVAHFSQGTQRWNYLNERDTGMIFYLLGCVDRCRGEYRIANTYSKPLREFILELAGFMGTLELCDFAESNNSVQAYGIDTLDENLFETISYWPRISFEDGIKEMIEERKKHIQL